jgi:hypothetical protein
MFRGKEPELCKVAEKFEKCAAPVNVIRIRII